MMMIIGNASSAKIKLIACFSFPKDHDFFWSVGGSVATIFVVVGWTRDSWLISFTKSKNIFKLFSLRFQFFLLDKPFDMLTFYSEWAALFPSHFVTIVGYIFRCSSKAHHNHNNWERIENICSIFPVHIKAGINMDFFLACMLFISKPA